MWNGDARLEHVVDRLERLREEARLEVRAVARRVHVGEVEHRSHPAGARRDLDDVVERAEVADAAHHLDAERHGASLPSSRSRSVPSCSTTRCDRVLALAAEEEAGVEDDDLGAAGGGDAGAAVERADGRGELAAARLEVPHEAEERRVHGERDVVLRARPRPASRPTGSPSRTRTRSRSRRRRSRARAGARPRAPGSSRAGMPGRPTRVRAIPKLRARPLSRQCRANRGRLQPDAGRRLRTSSPECASLRDF